MIGYSPETTTPRTGLLLARDTGSPLSVIADCIDANWLFTFYGIIRPTGGRLRGVDLGPTNDDVACFTAVVDKLRRVAAFSQFS